jgi:hypothetical protein
MARQIAYWSTTAMAALMLLLSLSYLTGNEQVVSGFAKAGYPQHLRIVLAYAGVTFAWVMAFISASASGESLPVRCMPLALLVLLTVSYVTRPAGRRLVTPSPTRR